MDIEVAVRIGEGIWFPHTWGTVIGGLSIIGKNCVILQGVTIGGTGNRKRANGQTQPIIGDNVMIGAGAKILGPVLIGDRVKVGANSVVLSDVKPGLAVMGVPAKNIFSN